MFFDKSSSKVKLYKGKQFCDNFFYKVLMHITLEKNNHQLTKSNTCNSKASIKKTILYSQPIQF